MTVTQIHIHLGSIEPGSEVHLYFGEPEPDGRPSKSQESPEAAMLTRMLANARTGNMHGTADPDLIQKVYDGLRTDKDGYLGVVFDWSAL